MSDDAKAIILVIFFSAILLAGGIHGVILRDKIKNRADYILSVCQIMGGITGFVWLLIYFSLKMSGRW